MSEELVEVSMVIFPIRSSDEEVINAGEAERNTSHYLINELLECLGRSLQSKRHLSVLKQVKRGDCDRLWDVVRMDWDLMKCLHQVNLGEDV